MTEPRLVALPPHLQEVQRRWRALGSVGPGRAAQDALYAQEFAPAFAPLFADLPLHGAPPGLPQPRALVSVLGLSWQPVALMAAWCRPARMLVLGSDASLDLAPAGEGVLSLVARVAGISRDAIEGVRVGDPGEADIYREVRDFPHRSGIPSREVYVDPTGGKKSMSAAAALAGFLAGSPLVYVDYATYDPVNRIPVAGTEYPRLLTNPLDVLGDRELRDIFVAFNRSDFTTAERLAEGLSRRLYEPREAQCLVRLARGYGAWDRFDFGAARDALASAGDILARFAGQGGWHWAAAAREAVDRNLRALAGLVRVEQRPALAADGIPLLVWYLAAARRLLQAGKADVALLLTYAAIERYVGLCLWTGFGIDADKPDYSLVSARLDRDAYHRAGRRLVGATYAPREIAGALMFTNGAQLLVALAPESLAPDDLDRLNGLSAARNRCAYEHGFLPQVPTAAAVRRYLAQAMAIVARLCGGEGELARRLEDCQFPVLETAEVGSA